MIDESMLVHAGCAPAVVAHCRAVCGLAQELAGRVAFRIDTELVRTGALLHDIGRARTHGYDHAIVGAEMVRGLGLGESLADIVERHIGAGITADEARRLGLPARDYLPETPEEKIVSYADNLVCGVEIVPFERALERFRQLLGPDHEGVGLLVRQHEEIKGWMRREAWANTPHRILTLRTGNERDE